MVVTNAVLGVEAAGRGRSAHTTVIGARVVVVTNEGGGDALSAAGVAAL